MLFVTGADCDMVRTVSVQISTVYRLFTLQPEAEFLPFPPLLEVQTNVAIAACLYVCVVVGLLGLGGFLYLDR